MDEENGWDIVGMSPAATEADLSDAIAQAKAGKARRMARIGAEGGSTQDSTSAPSGDGGGGGDDSAATQQRQWPCAAPASTVGGRTGAVGGWKQLELSSADGDVFDLSFVFDRNWWVEPSRTPSLTDAPPTQAVTRHDCCAGVLRDTFELHDVLSRAECDAIVRLADGVGFQRPKCGGGIGSQASTLPPPDRFVWVTDTAWCGCVYARLEQCLPQSIRGRRPVGINPRWRLYKYEPGFALLRHQDRSFKASGADAAGELRYDLLRDGSESLLTLLIYLNGEGLRGGGTTLYERDLEASVLREVSPTAGAALAFPHGKDNPDSVWHAGMPVAGGVKYIIRTDIIYGPAPPSPRQASAWAEGSGSTGTSSHDEAAPEPQLDAAGATWDEEQARAAFCDADEDEAGWMDDAGVARALALCGYAIIGTGGGEGCISWGRVQGLLDSMEADREDADYICVTEFCRLARMVHDVIAAG